MDWKLIKLHSARVVSHRAVAFGEDQPDSAIRQIIIRLASTQSLRVDRKGPAAMSASTASMRSSVGLSWIPDEAKKLRKDQARGNAPTREVEKVKTVEEPKEAKKEVVEYLVLQKRVLSGTEEKAWKVWGFAPESTPEQMEEDAAYWRKTLDAHAA
jgi:protein MBA1